MLSETLGQSSDGGCIVMAFYDMCSEIWEGSPSTNSIKGKESFFKWNKTFDLLLKVNHPLEKILDNLMWKNKPD